MLSRTRQSGDTLVEVMLALAVLGAVIVGALSIMNQGTAAASRALQTTLVRQAVDNQAETLRFLHAAYINAYSDGYAPNTGDAITSPAEEYYRIIQNVAAVGATAPSVYNDGASVCPQIPVSAFILNEKKATLTTWTTPPTPDPTVTLPEVTYSGPSGTTATPNGIWIEGVRSAEDTVGKTRYIDFHIRACWIAVGAPLPMRTGTIVRLYEPAV